MRNHVLLLLAFVVCAVFVYWGLKQTADHYRVRELEHMVVTAEQSQRQHIQEDIQYKEEIKRILLEDQEMLAGMQKLTEESKRKLEVLYDEYLRSKEALAKQIEFVQQKISSNHDLSKRLAQLLEEPASAPAPDTSAVEARLTQLLDEHEAIFREFASIPSREQRQESRVANKCALQPFGGNTQPTNRTCDEVLRYLCFDRQLPPVALASYPRSGNTKTRQLLQRATGYPTGSIYNNDRLLLKTGLWGDGNMEGVLVIKTHLRSTELENFGVVQARRKGLPRPENEPTYRIVKAIHLVRNPFDAIDSWFNFLTSQTHIHTVAQRDPEQWARHVRESVKQWASHTEYWMNVPRTPPEHGGCPTLLVRYEDLVADTEAQLYRILDFLGFDRSSLDPDRIRCALELTAQCRQEEACRSGKIGAALRYYSNELRQLVIDELGDYMRLFGYNTDVPLLSDEEDAALSGRKLKRPNRLPLACPDDSPFMEGVRAAQHVRDQSANGEWDDIPGPRFPLTIFLHGGGSFHGWGQPSGWFNPWAGVAIEKRAHECMFTRNQSLFDTAALVVFNPPGHTHKHGLKWCDKPEWFPDHKPPFQKWAAFWFEQHEQFPNLGVPAYMRLYDWNITYDRRVARVPITMTCTWGRDISEFLAPPPPKTHDKVAVYFASRCEKRRDDYVQALMDAGLPVDSYGRCLHNKDHPNESPSAWPRNWFLKIDTMREYKFVLAFENLNLTDWVTEKMPHAVMAGSVPVFMGADNVDDWAPGEHSIIKTSDFGSPKELAEYLLRLNEDDDEYYRYFEWKKNGLAPGFLRALDDCVFQVEWKVCEALKEDYRAYVDQRRSQGLYARPLPEDGEQPTDDEDEPTDDEETATDNYGDDRNDHDEYAAKASSQAEGDGTTAADIDYHTYENN